MTWMKWMVVKIHINIALNRVIRNSSVVCSKKILSSELCWLWILIYLLAFELDDLKLIYHTHTHQRSIKPSQNIIYIYFIDLKRVDRFTWISYNIFSPKFLCFCSNFMRFGEIVPVHSSFSYFFFFFAFSFNDLQRAP